MGLLEVSEGKSLESDIEFLQQWRKRWNIERGGPQVGKMDDVILEHGGHGPEFIIDFIIYSISTCIFENANGTCHFLVLKYLCNVNEIHNYNWCAYVIKCLNNAIIEWKGDKRTFFTNSLLFLMLCENKVERWFPVAINWPMKNYAWLKHIYKYTSKNWKRNNTNKEYLVNFPQQLQLESNDVHIVHIAMKNFKKLYLSIMSSTGVNQTEQIAYPQMTLITTVQSFWNSLDFHPKDASALIARISYQHTNRGIKNAVNFGKSEESTKDIHKEDKEKAESRDTKGGTTKPPIQKDSLDNQADKKGKEVVVRQQPKRIVKEMPFVCRSPYLKDYGDFRDQLKLEKKMLVDYPFLPPDELHPSM
ncbi:LOW QUALITY PROTEIN: hypothetical protein Cgig2_019939 [Carnegiea gigantea]|uniref:Aminotransferase-like plant mobile domain-containing protein n=1 Tax=Carnegiea gigantea TaxID=171969 RepID=A0A9Q1QE13_9CARY|nr:LOW QUALITY PROTEIN: hypothetical protein Cgig2_019939 [Carnegiea gigantea]